MTVMSIKETPNKDPDVPSPAMMPRRLGEGIVKVANQNEKLVLRAPNEGDVVTRNGKEYRFVKVASGAQVYDPVEKRMVPHYHSLKTFFSHSTDGIASGPGWDTRLRLLDMSPEDMMGRFGHGIHEGRGILSYGRA